MCVCVGCACPRRPMTSTRNRKTKHARCRPPWRFACEYSLSLSLSLSLSFFSSFFSFCSGFGLISFPPSPLSARFLASGVCLRLLRSPWQPAFVFCRPVGPVGCHDDRRPFLFFLFFFVVRSDSKGNRVGIILFVCFFFFIYFVHQQKCRRNRRWRRNRRRRRVWPASKARRR